MNVLSMNVEEGVTYCSVAVVHLHGISGGTG